MHRKETNVKFCDSNMNLQFYSFFILCVEICNFLKVFKLIFKKGQQKLVP
jgi:hypothetical protein